MKKLKKYNVSIVFKHLPHWTRLYTIVCKSKKKAETIYRHMFKDDILKLTVEEIQSKGLFTPLPLHN